MNDLDLITQLRPDVPLATREELAHARARLTDRFAAAASSTSEVGREGGQDAGAGPRRPRWSSRRLGLAVAAAGVAAGVVAALVVVPGHGGRPNAAPANGPGEASATPSPYLIQPGPAISPFTGHLTLASFLHAAANAALRQPATPPGPNQFVYGETAETFAGTPADTRYQIWLSADGEKKGLIIQPGHYPVPPCPAAQAGVGKCSVSNGYLPDLPTQPTAAMAYLIKIGVFTQADTGRTPENPPTWAANDVGKQLEFMLTSMYFLPAQRAALYELMAGIKGFRIVPHATLLGHRGIGVAWTYLNAETTLVFSPENYAFLGSTSTVKILTGKDKGRYIHETEALVKLAVVNRAGQLP